VSKPRTNNGAGRDQYNVIGDDARLNVDNRTTSTPKRSVLVEVGIGLVVAVLAGFFLFLFKWN
jgi:hypothetical protein